ncbi:PH domain-containing protein [Streptosporangium lutulentum]|uniref:Membrane protein YdbT with pleckstrin-like domain n=1 Tax=Streptosporangium lutulentum TaxID=1461250 RepID=A0ABT9QIG3_9ACTN|nr:PH domain-containing protein [Streptosporangium lutulentum]MDP9846540.1 putative membrane protein YdbT with pleckstrin-like domain [Streptosporangium lutulentum]
MSLPDRHMTEGERRIRSFHPHWKRLVAPLLALVIIVIASSAVIFFMPAFEYDFYAHIAVLVIAVGLLTVWSFVPYLRWKNTSYMLTSHRFTISTGVLNKSIDDIPMTKVNSVSADQTLMERLLGCGTLTVESASEQGQIVLRDIPEIQDVRAELFRALDDATDGEPSDRGEPSGRGGR